MMRNAYVDTNIFDYVALRNPTYGKACLEVLQGIGREFNATCSFSVPLEILGSLSRKNSEIAFGALMGFFSFDLKLVEISKEIIMSAIEMSKKTGINGYDAIHAATMRNESLEVIITENYNDFKMIKDIEIVRPLNYKTWLNKN